MVDGTPVIKPVTKGWKPMSSGVENKFYLVLVLSHIPIVKGGQSCTACRLRLLGLLCCDSPASRQFVGQNQLTIA